jgi:oligoendopeptidase F
VYGQVGSASNGYHTLFHEGGHAAHYLNTVQKETCLNSEYPPASTAWAETQSMFFDSVYSTFEWKQSYAKNKKGEVYSLELFERKLKKLSIRKPLGLSSILMISNFERDIYECKNLTKEKVKKIARYNFKKFTDMSEDSLWLLNVPHIYSWSSACSYHGYGLADLAQTQWRAYFKKKYGYIVDNPKVGKEMTKVWALGAKYSFKEFVKMATGTHLSPHAWIKENTKSVQKIIQEARALVKSREVFHEAKKKRAHIDRPINLNVKILMVNGEEKITDNSNSFEKMADDYAKWLNKQ